MEIETYEQVEVSSETGQCEDAEEQRKLAEELGLAGQLQTATETTICPYRKITLDEQRVFEALFESKTKIEEYCDGPIPLRVLKLIANAKNYPQLGQLYIWHEASEIKDPVLIGVNKSDCWLLARWGDALDTMENLTKKAGLKIKRKYILAVRDIEQRLAAAQSFLKSNPNNEEFLGCSIPQSYNW